jgi:hypothetical protein
MVIDAQPPGIGDSQMGPNFRRLDTYDRALAVTRRFSHLGFIQRSVAPV